MTERIMTSSEHPKSSPDQPLTLLAMAGRGSDIPPLAQASLVLIDLQNEYLEGPLQLPDAITAVDRAATLLHKARTAGARVIHVAHRGGKGGMFDRDDRRGAIIDSVRPIEGEAVIEKPRPNAFSGTSLAEALGPPQQPVFFAGLMTHMCVSSTVRAALDLGYQAVVVGDACATRDLPLPNGGVMGHRTLHDAELAALADRFATIATERELT
jgi:nicotinamidase-related amidase